MVKTRDKIPEQLRIFSFVVLGDFIGDDKKKGFMIPTIWVNFVSIVNM